MPITPVSSPVFRPAAHPGGSEEVGKLSEDVSSLDLSASPPLPQTGAMHRQNELVRLANQRAARKIFTELGVKEVAQSFTSGKLRSAGLSEGVKLELAKLMIDEDMHAFLSCVHGMGFQQEGTRFELAKLCAKNDETLFLGIDEEEGEEFSTSKVTDFNLSEESKFALAMEVAQRNPELFSNDLVLARFDIQDGEHMLDLLNDLAKKGIDVYSDLQLLSDKIEEEEEGKKPFYMQFSNQEKILPLLGSLFINYANTLRVAMPQGSQDVETYLGIFKGLFPCFGNVGVAGSLPTLISHFSGPAANLLQKIDEANSLEKNPRVKETLAQWGFMTALLLRHKTLPQGKEKEVENMLEGILAWRNPEGRKELTSFVMRSGFDKNFSLFEKFMEKFDTPQKRLFASALWPIYQDAADEAVPMAALIEMLQRKTLQSSTNKRDAVMNGVMRLINLANVNSLPFKQIFNLLHAAMTEQSKPSSRKDKAGSASENSEKEISTAASFTQAMRDLTFISMLHPTLDKNSSREIMSLQTQNDIHQLFLKNAKGLFVSANGESDQAFIDEILNYCQNGERMPLALLIYAGYMRSVAGDDPKMVKFFDLFTQFIKLGLLAKDKDGKKDTKAYSELRYGKASPHMEMLHAKAKKELDIWKEPLPPQELGGGLTLHDSDEPWDLFIAGTEIPRCQRVEGPPEVTKSLLNNCLDGKFRTMVIRNEVGKIVAYRDYLLLWDKKLNKPVIHMNRLYQDPGIPLEITKRIAQRIRDKAELMKTTLVCGDEEVPGMEYEGEYPNPIHSLGAATPFEYADQYVVEQTGEGVYAVKEMQILYSP